MKKYRDRKTVRGDHTIYERSVELYDAEVAIKTVMTVQGLLDVKLDRRSASCWRPSGGLCFGNPGPGRCVL